MFSKNITSHKRSNIEIIAEILQITKYGANKTKIVYGANLNFKLLKEYLNKLEKAGLVEVDPATNNKIKITQKGQQCLKYYEGLGNFGLM